MKSLLSRSGFKLKNIHLIDEPKELYLLCQKGKEIDINQYEKNKILYDKCLAFLNDAVAIIEKTIDEGVTIGIWGMSNAGIWVEEVAYEYMKLCGKNLEIVFIEDDKRLVEKKRSKK